MEIEKKDYTVMLEKKKFGLTWFEFSLLQPFSFIRHGCFTRRGGVSSAPFDSLNVQPFPEENPVSVQENRARIQQALTAQTPLVDLEQVHGVHIAVVRGIPEKTPLGQFDALITNIPQIPLTIKHADCQACLIVDPEHKAVAAIHCGWRGNVQNIYEKVIQKLAQEYGSRPEALFACVGPSLGPRHAEFTEWKDQLPEAFWRFKKGDSCLDLWEIAHEQLSQGGIKEDHIEIAKMCTFHEKESFFSFRRDRLTGRNATCIMILPSV